MTNKPKNKFRALYQCPKLYNSINNKILFVLFFVLSCDGNKNSLLDKIPHHIKITTHSLTTDEIIPFAKNDFSYFSDFILLDSFLVVNKLLPNPYFYTVYNINNRDSLYSFGKQGNGPNEFTSFSRTSIDYSKKNRILVMIPNEGKVYSVILDSLKKNHYTPEVIAKPGYSLGALIKHGNSFFVTNKKGRIAKVDSAGTVLNSGLKYPFEDQENAIPSTIADMSYQGDMKRQPYGERAILANVYAPNFDVFNLDSSISLVKKSHLAIPIVYDQSGDVSDGGRMTSIAISQDNEFGYQDLEVTREYIYLLYSGRSYSEYEDSAEYGNLIYILNWDGDLLFELKLDNETREIIVSPDNSTLYTLDENLDSESNTLRKYSLTNIF